MNKIDKLDKELEKAREKAARQVSSAHRNLLNPRPILLNKQQFKIDSFFSFLYNKVSAPNMKSFIVSLIIEGGITW